MSAAAFCLAYAGFAALSLAMLRHYEDVFTCSPSRPRQISLRLVATVLLALSLWACIAQMGAAYGIVLWVGLLSMAGLALIAMLTYRPRWAWILGAGLVALAPWLI